MKKFKCPKCGSFGVIDDLKYASTKVKISCKECSQAIILNFGPRVIVTNNNVSKEFLVSLGETIIGRKSDSALSSIQIEDKYISRMHGKLELVDNNNIRTMFYTDLNSTNGTYTISKQRITQGKKFLIKKNDSLIIGLSKLKFIY
jgi:pSer/pThr/pTyr-binding forkhead associated (FHA) protein